MALPVISGLIDRRILLNYRVDPDRLAALLPAPFRPKLVHGFGIAGICLIRLKHVRPRVAPRWIGIASENAAHRVAVEWDQDGLTREGVYVLHRHTDSRINALAGGCVFPGLHRLARFDVDETETRFEVAVREGDRLELSLAASRATDWPAASVFATPVEASAFFQAGSLGYSPMKTPSRFEGLELRCFEWRAEPLRVDSVRSRLFDDENLFPQGSVHCDSAMLMQSIEHEWHVRPELRTEQIAAA